MGRRPHLIDDAPLPEPHGLVGATSKAWYDASTGIPGPAFWAVVLGTESARSARYHRPSTIVLAQVVGFDSLVRRWGLELAVLGVIDVVRVLRAGCRASDYVARLADDLIGMILTETDEIAAINMIERVRDRCDQAIELRAGEGRVAFGWASPRPNRALEESVAKAEELLRRDLRRG